MAETSGLLTEEEKKQYLEEQGKVYFWSNFKFLNEHRGHRPGNIHLYLGTTGGGKSTLMRTLFIDVMESLREGKRILVWLTEETRKDFLTEIYATGYGDEDKLSRVTVISEQEMPPICENDQSMTELLLASEIKHEDNEIVFFDNLTTSDFYEGKRPAEQSEFAKKLKKWTQDANVPIVLIAHTNAETSDNSKGLIMPNHIRGSKSICNIAQFLYVMQRFKIGEVFYPTIRIEKHRGQKIDKSLYMLTYHKGSNLYCTDKWMPFKDFEKIYKERNKL